jgi:hypothetical protein
LLTVVAITAAHSPGYAELFAVGPWPSDSSSPPMNLYTVDPSTGAATLIASTGVARIQGLTAGPSGDLLGTNGPRLYSIDVTSGAATEFATLPFNSVEGGLARRFDEVYVANSGLSSSPEGLYRYDLATMSGGFVGSFGFATDRDISAAAFDPFGVLHVLHSGASAADPELHVATVELATGLATDVLATTVNNTGVAGMAFDAAGNGFFTDGVDLYGFDVAAGVTQLVGPTGADRLSGLAFLETTPIPEPGPLALWTALGLAGAICYWARRRRIA